MDNTEEKNANCNRLVYVYLHANDYQNATQHNITSKLNYKGKKYQLDILN